MSTLVHLQFAKQCQLTPDNIALRSRGGNLTYRQLEHCSDVIAQQLLSRGLALVML